MNSATARATGVDPVWLTDQIFEHWDRKDLQTVSLVACEGFSKLSEPLEDLLIMLERCPGKQKGRSYTLGYHILQEFWTWYKKHPQVTLSVLTEQQAAVLQRRALSLLTICQPTFVERLMNIYQLESLDPAVLRLHIMTLHSLNCYKEAAVLGTKLKLQNKLNMEEMCIPLILQDKLLLAESFVTGHKHLEQQLVELLDSWCHLNFSVEQVLKRFPCLSLSKHCRGQIQPKMLTKHVLRLAEKFNVDQALCPNALYKRRLDSLRFLMYKRFVEKTMTDESWSDHVQTVVADDLELHVQLVQMLVHYCGLQKAAQWSLRYNIPRCRLPFGVWDTQQSLSAVQQLCLSNSTKIEEWKPSQSHCQRFYQVPLTKDQVHIVETPEGLQRCQDIVLKEGAIVGVDMEWQPTFGCISAQQVALMQLAVMKQVFLLDLCTKEFCQHPDTVKFIRNLFSKQTVLKLGYGMAGDLKCLLITWPQFLEEPLKMESVLDLLNIHQKIQRVKTHSIKNGPRGVLVGEDSAEKGLSLLVQQVLGKPLDKMEQMSNWKKRPLRISQIRYAVTDAFCLLDVYSALSSNPAHFGLPADLHTISSSQSDTGICRKEKQPKSMKQTSHKQECQGAERISPPHSDTEKDLLCGKKTSECFPPLHPQQLRVVCDNMLQGLGRYLRCLGVDVVMLENTDEHREAAEVARTEGRIILTSGQPYQSLRSQVGEGCCLFLDCSEKARDQAVHVLRHFNVQPTLSDIFSRCQACNSDEYLALPREDMARMLRERGFLQDQNAVHTQLTSHEEEEDEPGDILTPSLTPELPRYALRCRWAPLSVLDPDTLTFPGGAPIQLHTVPPTLLERTPLFYACTRCGKVFWEGSHFGRVLSQFQEILHISDEDSDSVAAPLRTANEI
ncbi:exonuclease mut-7 homolog isoform X2 [Thalassophryne amazonica]|uniref:exonuclease mut-7 homolog isoform X2 n=1 Tax=Thalassophryne amazonica TaxID=390379 RepID=UPI0014721119|nr:exonuclease mut-7 homolog isoform X2 [Thalassophryne amazonica]